MKKQSSSFTSTKEYVVDAVGPLTYEVRLGQVCRAAELLAAIALPDVLERLVVDAAGLLTDEARLEQDFWAEEMFITLGVEVAGNDSNVSFGTCVFLDRLVGFFNVMICISRVCEK